MAVAYPYHSYSPPTTTHTATVTIQNHSYSVLSYSMQSPTAPQLASQAYHFTLRWSPLPYKCAERYTGSHSSLLSIKTLKNLQQILAANKHAM